MEYLDLKKDYQENKKEIDEAILRVLESGKFIGGEEVEKFEEELSAYLGRGIITTSSGTDALYLSLKALEIGEGDEVITTPFTFIASSSSILNAGAKPVFVDITEDFNINPDLIEAAITERTKAILPVHLFGNPAKIKRISEIAKKYNLYVIEDAAQAIGGSLEGKRLGTFGELGIFSFYPTKNLGAYGDGGAIACSTKELARKIRGLKNHGVDFQKHYYHTELGINSRLDSIQAAILRVKLKNLDSENEKRRELARYYSEKFKILYHPYSVYHQFTIRIKDRDTAQFKFPTQIYYPYPLHLLPVFQGLGYGEGDFPEAEKASKECLSIPLKVSRSDQDLIIKEIKPCLDMQ